MGIFSLDHHRTGCHVSGQNRQANSLEVCPHDLIQLLLKDPNFKLSVSGRGVCSQYTGLLGDTSTRLTSAAVFPGHSLLLSVVIIIPNLCPLYSLVTRGWEEIMLCGFSTNIPSEPGWVWLWISTRGKHGAVSSCVCLSPCLHLTLMDGNLPPQRVVSLWALKEPLGYRDRE